MSVFELDTTGNQQALDDAQKNLFDTTKPKEPGFFDNFVPAVGSGIMKGGARVGQAVGMAASVAPVAYDYLRGGTHAQDWYFKNVVDDTANNAVDYWTADAATTGTAGRTLGGLAEIVLPLAAGGGNPTALIASQQIGTSTDLAKQGVDSNTALNVGLMQGASTAIGFRAPAAVGSSLGIKVGSGAAINVAIGGATEAMQHNQLQGAGYDDIAKQFDPLNIEGRGVDLLTGGVFGAMAHVQTRTGRPVTQEQTDAILTERNAQSFQRDTAPGIPADGRASVLHQDAMQTALEQMRRGEAVDVKTILSDANFIAPKNAKRNTLGVQVQDAIKTYSDTPVVKEFFGVKTPYDGFIDELSKKYKVPVDITRGIITIESGWSPRARSEKNAGGLMQVMPENIPRIEKALGRRLDMNNPRDQIEAGLFVLDEHRRMNKGDLDKAIHTYHGGFDPKRWGPRSRAYLGLVKHAAETGVDLRIKKNPAQLRFGGEVRRQYAEHPVSREAWKAEVEPVLLQGKKGESVGHIDEIAAMLDRKTPVAERINFDFVDDLGADRLAEATGLDLSNYRYVIDSGDVAQMRTSSVDAPHIEPMTRAEVMRIPEIVRTYDRASSVDNIIRLEKDDGNKTYVLDVERGKRELSVKRMRAEERKAPVNVPETVARTSQPTQQPAPRQTTPETTPAPSKVSAEPVATKSDSAPQAAEKTTQQPVIKNDVDLLRETVKRNPDAEVMLGFDDNGEPVRMKLSEALETIEADMQREIKDADGYMAAVTCMLARG